MFMAAREQSRASKTPAEAGRSEFARIDLSPLTGSAAIVSRHKRLIAVSGVLGLAAAALFILIAPERFTAATQLLIEPRELRVFDKSVTEPSAINDTATAKVETQVRVLTSDSVLRRVIEHDALMADSEFNGRRRLLGFGSLYPLDTASASSDSSSVGSATVAGERQQDLAAATLDNFRRRVTVKPVPRTFVVEVAVTTQDRRKSMRLADGIVQAYLEDQAVARASAARRAANALTGRLAELREALETAERRVEQFRSQNSIVAANGQFVNESQTADMNAQLSSAQAKTAEKKARYDQIRQLQRTGLELGATTEAVQSQTVAQLRSQYAAVARRESELTASLGPRHPRVIEARAELERARQL
ncbi:MAG: GumC family protein, partial [Variibacter sp.]|nr:GumC family protein [Variibacter sp.]